MRRRVTYFSRAAFEAADVRRLVSPERDLGPVRQEEPSSRVAWLEATGELIAVRDGAEGGRVTVLDRMGLDELERRLDGCPETLRMAS